MYVHTIFNQVGCSNDVLKVSGVYIVQGAKAIAEMLKKHSSLRVIELNNNSIDYSVRIYFDFCYFLFHHVYPNSAKLILFVLVTELGIFRYCRGNS